MVHSEACSATETRIQTPPPLLPGRSSRDLEHTPQRQLSRCKVVDGPRICNADDFEPFSDGEDFQEVTCFRFGQEGRIYEDTPGRALEKSGESLVELENAGILRGSVM